MGYKDVRNLGIRLVRFLLSFFVIRDFLFVFLGSGGFVVNFLRGGWIEEIVV